MSMWHCLASSKFNSLFFSQHSGPTLLSNIKKILNLKTALLFSVIVTRTLLEPRLLRFVHIVALMGPWFSWRAEAVEFLTRKLLRSSLA